MSEKIRKIVPKQVSMFELFYDLIYVFAVSKMTGMINTPTEAGVVPIMSYLKFLVSCVIIMTIWYNQTVYINKYSDGSWYDKAGIFLHMFGVLYAVNSVSSDWTNNFVSFNQAGIFMFIVIFLQFYLRSRTYDIVPKNIEKMMKLLIFAIVITTFAIIFLPTTMGLFVASSVYFVMILFPSVLTKTSEVQEEFNFPHLVERISLITIIFFGEMVVSLAELYKHFNFNIFQVILYLAMISLFLTFVFQIEKFVDNDYITNGYTLVYATVGICIGINTITASIGFVMLPNINWLFLKAFRWFGFLVFYMSLELISVYNKKQYKAKEFYTTLLIIKIVLFLVGAGISFLAPNRNIFVFYSGILFTTASIYLANRFYKKLVDEIYEKGRNVF